MTSVKRVACARAAKLAPQSVSMFCTMPAMPRLIFKELSASTKTVASTLCGKNRCGSSFGTRAFLRDTATGQGRLLAGTTMGIHCDPELVKGWISPALCTKANAHPSDPGGGEDALLFLCPVAGSSRATVYVTSLQPLSFEK
eukprot:scaffold43107_cov69-Phaeocystis_antarctica.AAC.15